MPKRDQILSPKGQIKQKNNNSFIKIEPKREKIANMYENWSKFKIK